METYKLSIDFFGNASGVTRHSDGAFIPNDPNNRDWIEYQKWLADGNTPEGA